MSEIAEPDRVHVASKTLIVHDVHQARDGDDVFFLEIKVVVEGSLTDPSRSWPYAQRAGLGGRIADLIKAECTPAERMRP